PRHDGIADVLGDEYRSESDDRHGALARFAWYARLGDDERTRLREHGNAVMDAVELHLSGAEDHKEALAGMARLGRAYGMELAHLGLSPVEIMDAFRLFRASLIESIRRIAERPARSKGLSGMTAM